MCPDEPDDRDEDETNVVERHTPTTDSESPLTAIDVAPVTATDLNVLPAMSGEITAESIDLLSTAADGRAGSRVRSIDVNATIATKKASDAAEQVRDRALDIKRDFDAAQTLRRESSSEMKAQRPVDVNATIVSKRAAGAAEHERDVAMQEIQRRKGDTDAPPPLDAQDEALIATLKALPPEGVEPNWRMMEDAIADEVRGQPTYVPWWKSWHYAVPLGACAAAAVITLVLIKTSGRGAERTSLLAPRDAGVVNTLETTPGLAVRSTALWLDGEAFEIDEISDEALQQLTPDLDDPVLDDTETDTVGADEAGILPTADYGWIDELDEAEATRAEAWLAGGKS